MIEPLLIVGGSVRAAAMSARRAGFEPLAIDRFADADLQGVCRKFLRYDKLSQMPELSLRMPAADWIYSGPLENCPELIEQLGSRRNLLGNNRSTLLQLRDPWCVAAELATAGLRSPELSAADHVPAGRDWLRKPLRAAGGHGIARSGPARTGRGQSRGGDREDSNYFQKFISGRSIGACFLGVEGRAEFVGATEQLLGPNWGGCHEFQYVGSYGPIALSPEQTQALTSIGDCIAERFPVRGLFGVDAVVNEAGVWPVEVNPRYTASVEVLERALNIATIGWHVAACRRGELPAFAREDVRENQFSQYGKAIVYARREVVVETSLEREFSVRNGAAADPLIADIPCAGTRIQSGDPIVTVFAKGKPGAGVKQALRARWKM